jgi:Glutamyl-tRNAGlu reductase, dimerisation domain
VLMDQSSGDNTLVGFGPPRRLPGDAVSHQSSRDKRRKRSPGRSLMGEGKAISGAPGAGARVTSGIAALHDRAEGIRRQELARLEGRWESLSDADRVRLEALTRTIVGRLLHLPTVRLQAAVEDGEGLAHLESLRHLFALEAEAAATALR